MRPSARATLDGYQRPCAMSWTWLNCSVAGSKTVVVRMPRKGLYCRLPPTVRTRPSGKNVMALQNRSQGMVWVAKAPVTGSHTVARYVVIVGSFSEPATMSTRPVRSSAAWMGLIGTVCPSVCHWPTTLTCAWAAPGDPIPAMVSVSTRVKSARRRKTDGRVEQSTDTEYGPFCVPSVNCLDRRASPLSAMQPIATVR